MGIYIYIYTHTWLKPFTTSSQSRKVSSSHFVVQHHRLNKNDKNPTS